MITVIRRRMKSSAYKIVLWVVILAMAGVFSLPELIKIASGKSKWIVRINDTVVEHDDFARAVAGQQEFVDMLYMQFGQNAEMLARLMGITLDPQQLAYDKVIRDAVLNQAAGQLGIKVHEDAITQQLRDGAFLQQEVPELVSRSVWGPNGIEISLLRAYLQRMGLTVAEFENRVGQAIARRTVLSCVSSAACTIDAEIKERFVRDYLGKKFSMISLPLSTFVDQEKAKEITKVEIAEFFNRKNTEEKRYWIPEKRAGVIWRFDPKQYGITITDEAIENYYDANKGKQFVEHPAQVQVRRMSFDTQVQAEEAKRKFAADSASFAKTSELLAPFARGTYDREFERAAFLLKNDGDFSDILRTEKGFELIQRISKKQQAYKPLKLVRDDIYKQLVEKKFASLFEREAKQALNDNTWQEFVAQKGAKQEAISLMANDNSPLAKVVFSLGSNAYKAQMEQNQGIMIQVTALEKRNLPALEAIQDTVRLDLVQERAHKARSDALESIRKELQTQDLQQIAQARNIKVKQLGFIKPEDKETIKKLTAEGVPAAQLLQLEKVGTIVEVAQEGIIGRLDEIEPFDEARFKENYSALKRAQMADNMQVAQRGFIASLYRNATIKTNKL